MLEPWDYSSWCSLIYSDVSFRVRCGAPCVRSFTIFRLSLYRRTPLSLISYQTRAGLWWGHKFVSRQPWVDIIAINSDIIGRQTFSSLACLCQLVADRCKEGYLCVFWEWGLVPHGKGIGFILRFQRQKWGAAYACLNRLEGDTTVLCIEDNSCQVGSALWKAIFKS